MAILTLRPNGDSSLNWTFPIVGNHYTEVDESTDDGDTTRIGDDGITLPDGSNDIDYFDLTDAAFEEPTVIRSVTVYFKAKRNVAGGTGNITPRLRLGSDVSIGTSQALASSYTLYSQTLPRPGGGNWDVADIENLEVGVESSNGSGSKLGDNIRCTQIYVELNTILTFETIEATGEVISPFVNPDLYCRSIDSDLTGADEEDKKLLRDAGGETGFESWTVATLDTETNYFYTDPDDPLNNDWETGNFVVYWDHRFTNNDNSVRIRMRVTRISNTGTVIESSDWSDYQSPPWSNHQILTFPIPEKNWSAGNRTDRLRLDIEIENQDTVFSSTHQFYYGSSYLRTQVHQWRKNLISAIGHVIQERDETIEALGHIIQERDEEILAIGHIIQERSEEIEATGHVGIEEERLVTIQAIGYVESSTRKRGLITLLDVKHFADLIEYLLRLKKEQREKEEEQKRLRLK